MPTKDAVRATARLSASIQNLRFHLEKEARSLVSSLTQQLLAAGIHDAILNHGLTFVSVLDGDAYRTCVMSLEGVEIARIVIRDETVLSAYIDNPLPIAERATSIVKAVHEALSMEARELRGAKRSLANGHALLASKTVA